MIKHRLGILGGGQLGRMSALAAARLGLQTVIFTSETDSPAAQVSNHTIIANYDDKDALNKFAASVDTITYEFENIPVETIIYLKSLDKIVYPDENLLNISQDRLKEKAFLNDIGIPTTRWAEIIDEASLNAILEEWDAGEIIIKTARFGYDGKGQLRYNKDKNTWSDVKNNLNGSLIAEEIINFSCEISTICARDVRGSTALYGPMLNAHKNHILHTTTIPSGLHNSIEQGALNQTKNLAEKIGLVGILTVEFFVTKDGKLLANEIAPRTHNSGHWSIDACTVSQFENHVRAVCGLPIAPIGRHSDALMLNLIGDDVLTYKDHITEKSTCIHLYGKQDIKPGRKMGHITFLKDKS
jgi:5-(carboxyamino)imidazole ribonucleotide synthase